MKETTWLIKFLTKIVNGPIGIRLAKMERGTEGWVLKVLRLRDFIETEISFPGKTCAHNISAKNGAIDELEY